MNRVCWAAAAIATIAALALAPATARADAPAPSHGGTMLSSSGYHFEIVRQDDGFRVFPFDGDGNPIDPAIPGSRDYLSGSVKIHLPGSDKGTIYPLMPYDDESLRVSVPGLNELDRHDARIALGRLPDTRRAVILRVPAPYKPPQPGSFSGATVQVTDGLASASGQRGNRKIDVKVAQDDGGYVLVIGSDTGGEWRVPLQNAPVNPTGFEADTMSGDGGAVRVVIRSGSGDRMYWVRVDKDDPDKVEAFDGDRIQSAPLPKRDYGPARVLSETPTRVQTIGSDGNHYTRLIRGSHIVSFKWIPGTETVKVTMVHRKAGDIKHFELPLPNRRFDPRIVKTDGDSYFISLDGSTVQDFMVIHNTRSGRDSLPYLDNGNIVLKPARYEYDSVFVAGNGIGTTSWTWDTSQLDENFIRPPHWRPFSNGFVTGWIRKTDNLLIRGEHFTTAVSGARVAETLFEQTAIWGVRSVPIAGNLVMIGEAIAGEEIITGRDMGDSERVIHGTVAGLLLVVEAAPAARALAPCKKGTGAGTPVRNVGNAVDEAARVIQERVNLGRAAGLTEREAVALSHAVENLTDDQIRFLRNVKREIEAGRTVPKRTTEKVEEIVRQVQSDAQRVRTPWSRPGGSSGPEVAKNLSVDEQVKVVTNNVAGVTEEQARYLIEAAQKRRGTVVFGGSRVRGDVRIVDGKIVSDLDVGFEGLTPGQINKIVNNFNKTFTGTSQGAGRTIEHTWIYPGSKPRNIPQIETPEEFFSRSGIRSDGPNAGQPYGPSGSVRVAPDGEVRIVRPPDQASGGGVGSNWGLFRGGTPETEQFYVYPQDSRIVGYIRPSEYEHFVRTARVLTHAPGERTLIVIGHGGESAIGNLPNKDFATTVLEAIRKPMATRPGGAMGSVSGQVHDPNLVIAVSCEQGCTKPLQELAKGFDRPVVGTPALVQGERGALEVFRELRSWRDGQIITKELAPNEAFTVAYPNDLRVIYIEHPERLFPGIKTQGRTFNPGFDPGEATPKSFPRPGAGN